MLKGENRVRLVFQGVAALAENMMDGPLRAPKAGALPTALHPDRIYIISDNLWKVYIQKPLFGAFSFDKGFSPLFSLDNAYVFEYAIKRTSIIENQEDFL